ncbi:MAG: DUF1573 domain-containing protein [Myxococcota bacterium]|nr:DUF1573 domain-containing protein [Myxococcota bacterium]
MLLSDLPGRGWVAACLCFAALAADCRARTHGEGPTGSAHSVDSPDGIHASSPRVVCDERAYDFGPILQGDRPSHVFRIRNAGSAPLHIAAIDRAYGCDVRSPPASVAPGDGTDLVAVCDTEDRTTRMADKLVVHTDDPLSPELVLELRATIEPLLAFTSRTVDCELAVGERESKEIRVTGRLATRARLQVEESDPAGPEVVVWSGHDGEAPGLRFTFAGSRVGHGAGQTRVATGLEKPTALTVLWSWRVRGNVAVEPTNPFIDLTASPAASVVVRVSSRRNDFRLHQAVITEGPFEAALADAERAATADGAPPTYAVVLRVRESLVPPGARGMTGTLRLSSNDPAEPQKDVPLFALGATDPNPM